MPSTMKPLACIFGVVLYSVCISTAIPLQRTPDTSSPTFTPDAESSHRLAHKLDKRSSGTAEFFMNQESHNNLVNQESTTCSQQATISRQAFNNVLVCPDKVSTASTDPDHKRSTCPWYYEADHNATRFPTTVLQAVSLCNYCIGSGGLLECVPIKQTFKGLNQEKQLDANGNFVWTEIEITTTVGFTCAGRRMATSVTTGTQAPSGSNTANSEPDYA